MTPKSFKKLLLSNDWGHFYYEVEKRPTADRKRGLPLHDGMIVRVRWPDKSISEETIFGQPETYYVHDHGDRYPVTSMLYYLKVPVRGLWTTVSLDSVEVELPLLPEP